jgi:Trypsin-like peptidase domain
MQGFQFSFPGRLALVGSGAVFLWMMLWVAASLPSLAMANTFGKDRREQQSAELEYNRSVGRILNGNNIVGTAFLIEDECTVMTNYHVAFATEKNHETGDMKTYRFRGPRDPESVRLSRATFYIERNGSGPLDFKVKIGASIVDFGTYAKNDARGRTGDFAIYRLDECVGRQFGFLKVKKTELDTLEAPVRGLKMISYGSSTSLKAGVAVEDCRARDNGPAWGLVGVDCTLEDGGSGSPILEQQSNGQWLVVGIASMRDNPTSDILPAYHSNHRNVMVYASAWKDALEKAIAQGRKASQPSPGRP